MKNDTCMVLLATVCSSVDICHYLLDKINQYFSKMAAHNLRHLWHHRLSSPLFLGLVGELSSNKNKKKTSMKTLVF
ncbi:hypothetical protein [Streptococcus equinus]|uniref:hypothetical protein n=1 Tax=Streptococcus equinus TaxID=1335 RepID=UPI00135B78B9|nr:hypothetical protein [Streptococcus equinus]